MKKNNTRALFTEIPLEEGRALVRQSGSPFWRKSWEAELMAAFPYLSFVYFLYQESHESYVIRLARINGRLSTVPFSDGGDVYACHGLSLSLTLFQDNLRIFFGSVPEIRVHTYFCPVKDVGAGNADLLDFRVALPGFGVGSLRKTLRHSISAGLSNGFEVWRAQTPKDTHGAYRLYLKTMRRMCAPALPFRSFLHLASDTLMVCGEQGRIHGASIFLTEGETAYYFLSMTDAFGKKTNAAHHLLFQALQHFKTKKIQAVFLGGTRVGSSLQTFKEGWRGEPYFIYTISDSSRREHTRTSPLRAFWRFLPLWVLPHASRVAGKFFF